MEKYIKIFELFDKNANVFKNANVDKIEGQNNQPYTQTINYFFSFEEAKKKISSIWNFSNPQINNKINKELTPSFLKKFGDKFKDKLGISKEKEIKLKSLTSLGIIEKKNSNQLFFYFYKNLLIAKIEFDKNKIHNRSWKLTFYYYNNFNDDNKTIPGEINFDYKEKEKNVPGELEKNIDPKKLNIGQKNLEDIKNKKEVIVPFIDTSKKALEFIKKNLDSINKTSSKDFEIGDLKVSKGNNKKFKIITNNRTIEVNDPVITKGLEYALNYTQLDNSKEEKIDDTSKKKFISDKEEKIDSYNDFVNKENDNSKENDLLKKFLKLKEEFNDTKYLKLKNIYRMLAHPDKLGKVIDIKNKDGKNTIKRIHSKLDDKIIDIYKETEEILGNKLLKDDDKKNRIKGDIEKIIKIIKKEIE